MHMLNRRLQVLVDDVHFERLTEESKRSGAPVGELVRRAIDREFPGAGPEVERERAGRELLAMPPPPGDGPEPNWEDQKREMLDDPTRRWPGT
jgi:hypothetical protein